MAKKQSCPFGALAGRKKAAGKAAKLYPALSRAQALDRSWNRGLFLANSQPNVYNASTNPRAWNIDYVSGSVYAKDAGWVAAWWPYVQRSVAAQAYDRLWVWGGPGAHPETTFNWACVTSPEMLRRHWTAPMLADWSTFVAKCRNEAGIEVSLYSGLMNVPLKYTSGSYALWNTNANSPDFTGDEWEVPGNAVALADDVARLRDNGDMVSYGMDAYFYVEAYNTDRSLEFTDRLVNHHGVPVYVEGPHAEDEVIDPVKRARIYRAYGEMATVDASAYPASHIPTNGTPQGATSTTITLDASASGTDGAFVGWYVSIRSGPGTGEKKLITAYNGTTKVCTIQGTWSVTPTTSSRFRCYSDITLDADYATLNDPTRNAFIDANARGMTKIGFGNGIWMDEQKQVLRDKVAADPSWKEITFGV